MFPNLYCLQNLCNYIMNYKIYRPALLWSPTTRFQESKGLSAVFFLALSCTWFCAAGLHVWRQREHNGCFSLTACGSFLTACDSEAAAVKSRLANYYDCSSMPPIQLSILLAKTSPIFNKNKHLCYHTCNFWSLFPSLYSMFGYCQGHCDPKGGSD